MVKVRGRRGQRGRNRRSYTASSSCIKSPFPQWVNCSASGLVHLLKVLPLNTVVLGVRFASTWTSGATLKLQQTSKSNLWRKPVLKTTSYLLPFAKVQGGDSADIDPDWLEPPAQPCMVQEALFLFLLSPSSSLFLSPNPAAQILSEQREGIKKPSSTFLVTIATSSLDAALALKSPPKRSVSSSLREWGI